MLIIALNATILVFLTQKKIWWKRIKCLFWKVNWVLVALVSKCRDLYEKVNEIHNETVSQFSF